MQSTLVKEKPAVKEILAPLQNNFNKDEKILENYLGNNFDDYTNNEEIEFDLEYNQAERNFENALEYDDQLDQILDPSDDEEIGYSEVWPRKEIEERFERKGFNDGRVIGSLVPHNKQWEAIFGEIKDTTDEELKPVELESHNKSNKRVKHK